MRQRAPNPALISLLLAIAMMLAIVANARSDDPEPSGRRFPYTIALSADHRFFLHGEELTGAITFEYRNEALTVNGRRLLAAPPDSLSKRAQPDSVLLERWGGVPYVRECIARGESIASCTERFGAKRDSMIQRILRAWDARRSGLGAESAGVPAEALEDPLILLDPDVVGDVAAAREASELRDHALRFPIPGSSTRTWHVLFQGPTSAGAPWLSREGAILKLTRYAQFLEQPKAAIFIVGRSGEMGAIGADAIEASAEIDSLRANPAYQPKGPIRGFAREIRPHASR
jgi:hypothetical protein